VQVSVYEKKMGEAETSCLDSGRNKPMSITIGIPAYNEEGRIGHLLNELLSQVNSNVVEIVVSDDGSTDTTSDVVLEIAEKTGDHKCEVRLLNGKKRSGKAAAIDEILKTAKGDIVVLMDADMRLSRGCVDRLVEPFSKDKSLCVVSGNILPLNTQGESQFFSFASNFQRQLNDQLSRKLVDMNIAPKVNGAFFAFRRRVISRLPQTVVSDDEYISSRAQAQGYKVTYVPSAVVYTKDPLNLRDYLSKRRRVLGGHFLMRNTLHYVVPTTRIDLVLPELGKLSARYWRKSFYIIALMIFEGLCRPFAFSDAARGIVSPCYRVESSKFDVMEKKH
jgi:cellulose synthase/poly-beta-1,6-N-acetylglucosamine synthase-like glycosyltransferase